MESADSCFIFSSLCGCVYIFLMHEPSMQMELIRFVASSKPVVAATKVSERIIKIIKILLLDPTSAQV